MFVRSDDYVTKITMEALDREVLLDATITFEWLGTKIKARCQETGTYVQFPRALRKPGKRFVADVIKSGGNGRAVFYHAYKGSIRDPKTDRVVA